MSKKAAPSKESNRHLSSKESTLFKELLTLYETKQLKKGLKTADQILKKYPEHGETLCMKGLVLVHMGRREEGIELVRKGVRLDLTSHIVWHVFGLIQKGEKKYEDALKSYTQALRFDKENMNLLRDVSQLQTQLRLYDGLVETRHMLLRLRPTVRQHWIALAVAYHLSGSLAEAKNVMVEYEKTLKNVPHYDVEHSETLLYHVRVLEELGQTSEALSLLDVSAKDRTIVDKTAIMEIRARLLSKLGSDEAEHAWKVLIEHNPECYDYYKGYMSNQGLNVDDKTTATKALSILREFSTQFPKANVPRRLSLSLASTTGGEGEDNFHDLARTYLLSGLTKGIPSLFVDVKSLYKDEDKLQSLQDIAEGILKEFTPDPSSSPPPSSSTEPTSYLWTLYFLAQHYSYLPSTRQSALPPRNSNNTHADFDPNCTPVAHGPSNIAGDFYSASRAMEDARLLDGQDRFLNTKSAKYRMRAGLVDEASALLGMFTKKDAPSPGADLEDMQSLFYLLEEGDAHQRAGRLNLALKRYTAVQKVFDDFEDDQYDFHGYSLRKFTINVYINMLDWEDNLRSHPGYVKAALAASRIYVEVYDDPKLASGASDGGSTDAEKKAKKKAKKAQKEKEDAAKKAAATAAPTSTNEDKGLEVPFKDEDPDGMKLLSSPDPLERAHKFLQPLTTLPQPQKNIEVWLAVYDVAIRRGKRLQAVQALSRARALDAENPELHVRIIHAKYSASKISSPLPPPAGPVFTETLNALLPPDVSLETYNSQYLQRHSSSARAIWASAQASHVLGAPLQEVEEAVFSVLGQGVKLDVETALDISSYLKKIKSTRVDELNKAFDDRFPISTAFQTSEELAKLREWCLTSGHGKDGDLKQGDATAGAGVTENEAELGTTIESGAGSGNGNSVKS
ncbi:N-terminal acetyltransferase A, auxiliary subunit [Gymnopus androsaceus JB14]|uniref:N-terminal acetyltransferase A, auxiliary subunit n=1 Tax=Gymnopus androsaceus JB14 TaxID=1447944 RepID=A0A6A4H0F5_9AGAR|nr:N-terminal acetyltransferase A, auxiliary subunit [Gymnopus androsaceus JB14]